MEEIKLTRYQLLAAEIFGYSYANYRNHLGIGNARFDEIMPRYAETLLPPLEARARCEHGKKQGVAALLVK